MQLLGHNRHAPKIGGSVPFWGGGAGSSSEKNVARVEAYHRTKWHLDSSSRLATIDMGRKLGALHALLFCGGGAGSPSNTVSLGSRPTFLLSGILIHGATWPQPIWAENREAVPL